MPEDSEKLGPLTPEQIYDQAFAKWFEARNALAEEFARTQEVSEATMYQYVGADLAWNIASIRAFPDMYDQTRVPVVLGNYQATLRDCQSYQMTPGVENVIQKGINLVRGSVAVSEHLSRDESGKTASPSEPANRTVDILSGLAPKPFRELGGLKYCIEKYVPKGKK